MRYGVGASPLPRATYVMTPLSIFTCETIAAAAPPVPPPLVRPGLEAVLDSDGGARLATFRRPSALWMSAMRGGVSPRRGSAPAAPTSRSTATAPIPTSHFKARFNRAPPERLRGLDRRQPPGLRADRSREGPVLLDVHRRGRPLHHRAGRVVDRVVHERDDQVHRHPVLPALLPSLGQLRPTDPDALDSVRPPCASELVTLGLETRVLLRCESVLHCGQIPLGDTALDIGERDLRPLGEAVGIEARVHSTDVPETALEVGAAR